ncbi:hypothetical protein VYU27_006156 [Nannochloropsis oceanica]
MGATTETQTKKTFVMRTVAVRNEDVALESATGDGAAGDATAGGLSRSILTEAPAASTSLSSRLAPSSAQASASPIMVRPEARPPGLLGRLQTLGAVVFLGLMGSSLYLVIASALYIVIGFGVLGHRICPSILLGVWVGQGLISVKVLHQDPEGIKRSWLFREMANFFDVTLVMEQKLDTSKKYLFAQHPHGILPLAPVLSAYFISDVVPGGGKIFCLIHSGIFYMPIVRFFMGEWGALPANKESVAEAKQQGQHCSIVVGGVAEIFLQNGETEQLQLRKGFIREALRNGYDLVPMFHFGATRMYNFIGPASFWRSLSNRLPFPFFLIGGWGKGMTLLPKPVRIVIAVGSPIGLAALYGVPEGQSVPDPDPAKVDLIYEEWKKHLAGLYYRQRPEWETRELEIWDCPKS